MSIIKKDDAQKKNKIKYWSKKRFCGPIKNYAKVKAKLLTATYKYKVVKFKLYEDKLKRRVYFL